MRAFRHETTIATKIGKVRAVSLVHASGLREGEISLSSTKIEPKLPDGMSVQNCEAIVLVIEKNTGVKSLEITVSIETTAVGSSCCGEFLDAQEWEAENQLVVIGTEDSAALKHRVPMLQSRNIEIVEFESQSMTLKLNDLPASERLSFHFIVAENGYPEPVQDSAWFAVDQNHDYLLQR